MKDSVIYGDALCVVLSPIRTKDIVKLVLKNFIPGYSKIGGDYPFNLTTNQTFENEDEVLEYLEREKHEKGTIHWNKETNNPDRVMVGSYFTVDGQLILSLTVSVDGTKEEKYLNDLKSLLGSTTGAIYYNQFPEFKSGADFKNQYELQKRE